MELEYTKIYIKHWVMYNLIVYQYYNWYVKIFRKCLFLEKSVLLNLIGKVPPARQDRRLEGKKGAHEKFIKAGDYFLTLRFLKVPCSTIGFNII
jgi:hypothetical protein